MSFKFKFWATFSALLLCICLALPTFVSAADEGYRIEVSDLSAVPGDTVVISVNIPENAGLMAFTFTLCYDKDAFTFNDYKTGVFKDYLIVDHPESGYISVVNSETKNRTYTGVIFSAEFTVNDKASAGKHDFTVRHIYPLQHGDNLNGCFAAMDKDTKRVYSVMPAVKNGSVTVGKTCTNSGHEFSDYAVTVEPTCTISGVKSRNCTRCGHIENAEVAPKGHDFEDRWTIDIEATDTAMGSMSRHCKNCAEVTDAISFSKENAKDDSFENKVDEVISKDDSDFVKEKAEEIEKEKAQSDDKTVDDNSGSSDSSGDNSGEKITPAGENDAVPGESDKEDSSDTRVLAYVLIALGIVIVLGAAALLIALNKRRK